LTADVWSLFTPETAPDTRLLALLVREALQE
jgi:hypothetical protein